ncbi:response regulator [Paenibacillus sp. YN15]|uniref:response regulator n=1 Tax=Paenibacillus sp. YN15 TaxID=1742774 RepID=UPI0015EB36D3|nr:response regulator [Paenibacillus sp. YN15]
MRKLFIVDDERSVREGLRKHFDWPAHGIEVSGDAHDGDVALERIMENPPDIVLTDVLMPNMNGIELSIRLRTLFPEMKIVFISGHNDIDFLKKALEVQAVDYIFKPVRMNELEEAIKNINLALDREEAERKRIGAMEKKLVESMPLLREKFLLSLIQGPIRPTPRFEERLALLGLELPADSTYWIMVAVIDGQQDLMRVRSERDMQLLYYSFANIYQELASQYWQAYCFESGPGEFTAILRESAGMPEETLYKLAEELRETAGRLLKISTTVGVGNKAENIRQIPASFAGAREAAAYKWYMGSNRTITMDYLEQENEERFDRAIVDETVKAVHSGSRDALANCLDRLFSSLSIYRQGGIVYARSVSMELALLAGRQLLELGVAKDGMEQQETECCSSILRAETLTGLSGIVGRYLSDICAQIEFKRSSKPRHVIESVQSIIHKRYPENLLIEDIAREVYLSPTYLSLLFKQETGMTVLEYLTAVRMEKAKELLADVNWKLYEISGAVGYSDPGYFTKQFKRHTGFTPSAYRDQL